LWFFRVVERGEEGEKKGEREEKQSTRWNRLPWRAVKWGMRVQLRADDLPNLRGEGRRRGTEKFP